MRKVILVAVMFLISACTKNLQEEKVVYKNDFSSLPGTEMSGATVSDYNGNNVLGRYATGGIDLRLDNLMQHELVQISFDLYIHDNWRGNNLQSSDIGDSDIWIMNIDGNSDKYTTFSNGVCGSNQCAYQSYPNNFPFQNNPAKANASRADLPGACALKNTAGGTVRYKITRTVYHYAPTLHLNIAAQLNAHQGLADPLCDASWSMDNLVIKTIKFRD